VSTHAKMKGKSVKSVDKPRPGFLDPALYFLLAGFLIPAWPILVWMHRRFFEQDSYYSHGWLIPPAIAFLVWERRDRGEGIPRRPELFGAALCLAALGIYLAARYFGADFPAAWALVAAVGGAVASLEGLRRIKPLLAPFSLLLLMIPLPGVWLLALTARLKLASARVGIALARGLGFDASLDGVEVILPGSPPGPNLTIGPACSGLRSLLVFGALGLFLALLLPLRPLKKILLLILALLLAPLNNLLRVLGLILARRLGGPAWVEGFPHLVLGLAVFAFCLLLYFQVLRWITAEKES